jgi:transposase
MRVVRVLEDEIDRLVIEVADTRPVVRCPACGDKTSKVHETRRVEFRDLPLGRPAPLVWLRRRFECSNCGHRHTEDHPEIEARSPGVWPDRWCGTRSTSRFGSYRAGTVCRGT